MIKFPTALKCPIKKQGLSFKGAARATIILLIFFLPLFYGWSGQGNLELNKQLLLLVLGLAVFNLWFLEGVIEKKIKVRVSSFHFISLFFVLFLFISSGFARWQWGSFWGWPQEGSENFITYFSLFLFYFSYTQLFDKEKAKTTLKVILGSGFLAALMGLFYITAKESFFNTIGDINRWALLTASLVPISVFFAAQNKNKILKITAFLATLIFIFSLILVGHKTTWLGLFVSMAAFITLLLWKDENPNSTLLIISGTIFALALAFGVLGIRMPHLIQAPIEVGPTRIATLNVSLKMVRSSFKNALFGWGPGSFKYGWSLFKNSEINQSMFWNTRFSRGGSGFLEKIGTFGLLGSLMYFLLIPLTVLRGTNFKAEESWILRAGAVSSFFGLSITKFLTVHNTVLEFLWWLLLGVITVLTIKEKKKEIILSSNSKKGFILPLLFIVLVTISTILLYLETARYGAEIKYNKSLQEGSSFKEVEAGLENALNLNPQQEIFLRDLSSFYLLRAQNELSREDIPWEEKSQNATPYIENAIKNSKKATEVNPENVANWQTKAQLYQQLVGILPEAFEKAVESYKKALDLEPNNPYLLVELAKVHITQASLSQEEARLNHLKTAERNIEKAADLKPDYAPAAYQMATVYEMRGQSQEAIRTLENLKKIKPSLAGYDPAQDIGLAFQLGVLYYNEEELEKAEKELNRALGLNPDYQNAIYFLGLTYDKKGETEKALEQFEHLEELNPENKLIKNILSNLKEGKPAITEEQVPQEVPIKETPEESL